MEEFMYQEQLLKVNNCRDIRDILQGFKNPEVQEIQKLLHCSLEVPHYCSSDLLDQQILT